jgi:hypothetical protein
MATTPTDRAPSSKLLKTVAVLDLVVKAAGVAALYAILSLLIKIHFEILRQNGNNFYWEVSIRDVVRAQIVD